MGAKTGNICISGTMTNSVKIPMANPGFSTMASSVKCQAIVTMNIQLEMARLAPKMTF